jgi:hypothetical protein
MKKEYKNSIFPIFIILLLILGVIFYYTPVEGFQTPVPPRVINSAIRINNTCSDPNQTNIFDRFKFVLPVTSENNCTPYMNYVRYAGFPFDTKNVCLPECNPTKGWYEYIPDRTYCVRSNCINTLDLSGEIKASWTKVCAPIAKQNYTLTSTLASISTVTQTFNAQFTDVQSNYVNLYNNLNSYNCSLNTGYCTIRNTKLPALTAEYQTLNTIKTNINLNATDLSNKMAPFKTIYSAFGCDLFT